jgi:hypothetical protein
MAEGHEDAQAHIARVFLIFPPAPSQIPLPCPVSFPVCHVEIDEGGYRSNFPVA